MSLDTLSAVIGWAYSIIWSVANIPQLLTHHKRKSVSGYSIEFLVLNMIGYLFYFIYVWVGSYCQRHFDMQRTILPQDMLFATFASCVVYLIGFQAFVLYRTTRTGDFSAVNLFFAVFLLVIALYNVALGAGEFLPWWSHSTHWWAFSVVHYLGLGKSFCSLIKYIPQVILNYKKQNTVGYNILNAILDVSGGSLSILQMFIKCYVHPLKDGSPDWTFLTGNAPKTLLAVESIFFNLVFLTQHFILYRDNNRLISRQEELRLNSEALLNDPDIFPQHSPFVSSEYSDRSVN